MRPIARIAVLVLLTATAVCAADTDTFVVVANPSGSAASLSRADVSNMFMKKVPRWNGGQAVVPVDQPESSPVRTDFSKAVHKKPTAAIKAFWNQRVFAGADVPPLEVQSDAAVIEFLRKTPGAIGYVSTATNVSGLRVVRIAD